MNGSIATTMNIYYPIAFSNCVGVSAGIGNGIANVSGVATNGFTLGNFNATSWSYYSVIAVGY